MEKKKRVTNKQQREITAKKKADTVKAYEFKEIQKKKIHESMSKPITSVTYYDYLNVNKRIYV